MATVGRDGYLRIFQHRQQQLLATLKSYFGSLLCVAWSPDGLFLLTGGEDDLVSVWSLADRSVVSRCHAHNSFVRSVAFDPWYYRKEKDYYRFGSVGEDGQLILWDFSESALYRPPKPAKAKLPPVNKPAHLPSSLPADEKRNGLSFQLFEATEAPSRLDVPTLSPILVRRCYV